MDTLTVVVAITGSLTASIIGGTVVRAIGKYFEDIATQSALKEITTTVESIKTNLNKHNAMFIDEKNSMIEYLLAFNNWFEYAKNISNKISNHMRLSEVIAAEENLYQTFVSTNSKLELFLNAQLTKPSVDLNINARDFHYVVAKYLSVYFYYEVRRQDLIPKAHLEKFIGTEIVSDGETFIKSSTQELIQTEELLKDNSKTFSDNYYKMCKLIHLAKEAFIEQSRNYLTESVKK